MVRKPRPDESAPREQWASLPPTFDGLLPSERARIRTLRRHPSSTPRG